MARFGLEKNPSDILEELAKKHKTLRKQLGLSQMELARRSGVSLGSIKRFELIGQISLESLLKLAQILNRLQDFDQLLTPNNQLAEIEKLFSDRTRSGNKVASRASATA
jgi:transcriptional regulator with XRE-family HTH domain